MSARFNFAIAGLVLAGCATLPANGDPERFVLDGQHTHIVWQVDRFGFANTVGTFTEISGEVLLDEEAPEASSVVAEIRLSGLRSDLLEREDIVRGAFWLDAETHPVIRFQSNQVRLVASEECPEVCAAVSGEMTLKGVTAPVNLMVKLNKLGIDPVTKARAAGFSAYGHFQRSTFDVATALGPIGDEVTFEVQALAVKTRD